MKPCLFNITLMFFLSTGVLSADLVYHVPIHKTIDLGLPAFIERAIAEAKEDKASAIVFDIDTFGGRVDGATEIKNAILQLDSSITTVAFITGEAASAGALISLACTKIVMTKGASIGAATAVDIQGNKASEKVISYMRSMMRSTAEARGRSPILAEAMVDDSIGFSHVVVRGDSLEASDLEGSKKGKLLTLSTTQALKFGIADHSVETLPEVLEFLGMSGAQIKEMDVNWSEKLVRFLTDPIVSSLLMTLGFLGLLFEIQSPGWGIPGTVGIVALSLFFGATLFAELATMEELLILLVGVALVLAEVLVIPGFGVVGIMGIITIMLGLYLMLIPKHPLPSDLSSASWGLVIGLAGGLVGIFLMGRVLIRSRFWQKITLPFTERSSEGYSTSIGLEELVGSHGEAITDLRPAGQVSIAARRISAVSEGDFINKGDSVEVLSVEGYRVMVRKLETS
ncbi:MAG TPA: nodulation protein NfeD [Candidatus Marinimicrobia bacterium]|nr:nodulation protein NfeD [Candidatus Neomarinimicrobiota bacterium]HIB58350.1 nodulation protein NfeD [Candidatus Neomarinimicrobiota bacterium]HIC51919.1 nodulation protein NfeD [Candidatus Neomarinimicrobiota bacterium]HIM84007.1 nodulation protein NfeD [Candidatus Neomarinimicrobiota bacterium]HIN46445.1 nodulation protein NfeD [Candidatus Neomarinimicrobiota bacterium]